MRIVKDLPIGKLKQLKAEIEKEVKENILTSILAAKGINNMPLLHFYTLMESIIFLLFYRKLFSGFTLERYIPFMLAGFIVCFFMFVFFFQSLLQYNSYSKSLEALMLIFLSLAYFIKSLDKYELSTTYKKAVTYINSGILLYFSGSLILFILSNLIVVSLKLSMLIWDTHATFVLTMYILFTIGLWKYKE